MYNMVWYELDSKGLKDGAGNHLPSLASNQFDHDLKLHFGDSKQ